MTTKGANKSKLLIYLPKDMLMDLRIHVVTEKAKANRPGEVSISGIIEQSLREWFKVHRKPKT